MPMRNKCRSHSSNISGTGGEKHTPKYFIQLKRCVFNVFLCLIKYYYAMRSFNLNSFLLLLARRQTHARTHRAEGAPRRANKPTIDSDGSWLRGKRPNTRADLMMLIPRTRSAERRAFLSAPFERRAAISILSGRSIAFAGRILRNNYSANRNH